MKYVKIPRHADEPPHLLLWQVDEICPILIGFMMTKYYKHFRDNNPDGYFLHYLYWFGIPVSKAKQFVNPFIRTFIP